MKIRIEIEDGGMKSIHEFEGQLVRDRVIDFLTAADVFKETEPAIEPPMDEAEDYDRGRTLRDRLEKFIRYEFQDTWFSSQELRDRYETVSDDIKLSTVSTYLSRMYHDNILERKGNRNNRRYRLSRGTYQEKAQGVEHPDISLSARRDAAKGRLQ
jgi:hypothetical protein